MNDFTVIAEIGCSHGGSLERAKKLAKLAKLSGANIVKTQKRNPRESVKKELWDQPHPNQMYAYGKTYLEHRENLELSINDHIELKEYCESIDIKYSTSVWDMTSTREIVNLNPKLIKIPSACNDNRTMMKYLFDNYNGEIHISTGMLTANERNELYNWLVCECLQKRDVDRKRIILYHCTSGYPVPFDKLYLKEISGLCEDPHFPSGYPVPFDKLYLKEISGLYEDPHFPIGFSNHGKGIAMAPVCYTLGARYFEYHFIDDRLFPHTDSSNSLEPQGLNKLVRDLKAVSQALQYKPDELDKIEKEQRDKLRS